MAQDPSELTFGPYRVVRRIGRGCMGVVYHARDEAKNRDVALKVMLPEILSDGNARARFSREANAAAGLQHRNIVTVLEFSEDADAPYIAMEFLRGRSLAGGPALSRDAKLDIAIQLCEGLQFAHEQGVVHRDVKPANIWLLDDGGVKLLDFGIARLAGSTVTQYGNVVGSAAYMAPEQLAGKTVDGRADIFSAGVVLYELLAGRRPFEADTVTGVMMKILHEPPPPLQALVPGISEDVVTAVETALQKDPERRYAQAADFGADLRLARHLSEQIPIAVPADGTGDRAWPPGVGAAERVGTGERAAANLAGAARVGSGERPAVVSRTGTADRAGTGERALTGTGAAGAGRSGSAERAATSERRPAAVMASSTDETALSFDLHLHAEPDAAEPGTVALPAPRAALFSRPIVLGAAAAAVLIALIVIGVLIFRPPPEGTFQLDVQTTPAGAAIEINGAGTGRTTPAVLSVTTLPESIRLTLDGFAPVEAPLTGATASVPLKVQYALQRLLRIRSVPAGARILFDGRDTGQTTPADFPMPDPAPKSVELQLAGHASRRESMAAAALEAGEITWALKATGAATATATATTSAGGAGGAAGAGTFSGPRTITAVRLFGTYPFAVSGCGKESPPATDHSLQVMAPCRLQLIAREYFLDLTRTIEPGSARGVDVAAPEIVRTQIRSKHEDCRVILDGQDVGHPVGLVKDVAAGTHRAMLAQCRDNQIRETRPFQILSSQPRVALDDYIIIR